MKGSHHCQAIIIHCIDFRFQDHLTDWTKNLKGGFDRLSIAGAVKDLPYVISQIDISYRLHHVKEVYLINHEDCGAYGIEGTFKKHKEDLIRAKKAIKDKYPELSVFLLYLKLDGSFLKVD